MRAVPPIPETVGDLQASSVFRAFQGLASPLRFGTVFLAFFFSACRLLWIVQKYSVNVFIGDQWVYNDPTLFHRQSAWRIFRWQSGPWRQGLGGLLNAAIGSLSRWNSRTESFVAAAMLIVACLLALFLKVRLGTKLSVWDALIPLLVLSPVEYQTIVGVTHYSHGPIPLLLVMAFCLTWTIQRSSLKYPLVIAITFLSTYSGLGVFVGLICPFAIALELWVHRSDVEQKDLQLGTVAVILSCLSLLSFGLGFRFADGVCPAHAFTNPSNGLPVSYPNPLHYFLFTSFMFADFVGLKAQINLVPSILAGSGMLIGMLAALFVACRRLRHSTVPVLLISYSFLFALATAHGRMCLGLGAAVASRYMVYLVPALFGVYLLATGAQDRVVRFFALAVLAVVAFASSITIHTADREDMAALRNIRTDWKNCYLSERSLYRCNQKTGATIYSYPGNIQDRIDLIEREHVNFFAGSQP